MYTRRAIWFTNSSYVPLPPTLCARTVSSELIGIYNAASVVKTTDEQHLVVVHALIITYWIGVRTFTDLL
jgi:hypothetical protein